MIKIKIIIEASPISQVAQLCPEITQVLSPDCLRGLSLIEKGSSTAGGTKLHAILAHISLKLQPYPENKKIYLSWPRSEGLVMTIRHPFLLLLFLLLFLDFKRWHEAKTGCHMHNTPRLLAFFLIYCLAIAFFRLTFL